MATKKGNGVYIALRKIREQEKEISKLQKENERLKASCLPEEGIPFYEGQLVTLASGGLSMTVVELYNNHPNKERVVCGWWEESKYRQSGYRQSGFPPSALVDYEGYLRNQAEAEVVCNLSNILSEESLKSIFAQTTGPAEQKIFTNKSEDCESPPPLYGTRLLDQIRKLEEENSRLQDLVKKAFLEGYHDGRAYGVQAAKYRLKLKYAKAKEPGDRLKSPRTVWRESKAHQELQGNE